MPQNDGSNFQKALHYRSRAPGFTLSDGWSKKAGKRFDFDQSYTFDPAKKISQVEVIISKDGTNIIKINFYHHGERLVAVGCSDEDVVLFGGRVEVFEIADNEQLIGCELDFCVDYFRGLTWLKMKISN